MKDAQKINWKRVRAIGGLVIVIALALALKFLGSDVQSPTVQTGEQSEMADVQVVEKTLTERENTYEVTASYPQIESGVPAADSINRTIADGVEDITTRFIDSVSESPLRDQIPSTLNMTHTIASSADTFSTVLTVSEYHAGAAHPNSYIDTYVFNRQSGQTYSIEEVIGNRTLEMLAQETREKLQEQFADQESGENAWWEEGLAPNTENFSQFYIKDDTLTLVFNPYQIAPYAAGIIEVSLPYEK